jgi:hypothetical protein
MQRPFAGVTRSTAYLALATGSIKGLRDRSARRSRRIWSRRLSTPAASVGATTGLLGLVASVVAGQLSDRASHPAVFFYGAAFATAGTVALIWLVPADT